MASDPQTTPPPIPIGRLEAEVILLRSALGWLLKAVDTGVGMDAAKDNAREALRQ